MSAHEVDYLAQSHWHHFRYRIGEMVGAGPRAARGAASRRMSTTKASRSRRSAPSATTRWCIAVGSQSNDFGTPGCRANTRCGWRRPPTRCAFIRAWSTPASAPMRRTTPVRPEQLHVAIIGAGATGVELAAELHRTTREVVAFGLDRVDADKDIRVMLIEAAPRVLPALPPRLSEAIGRTAAQARRRGAHQRQGGGGRSPDGVRLADGRAAAGRAGRLGRRRQGAGLPEGHRRAGDQPHQPARGAADAADHARRRHLRHRRLRGLRLAAGQPGQGRLGAAARAGRAPAGLAHGRRRSGAAWPASR